ncbi:MAG: glycine--tRNA ligase subunit beta, partial [bacterium]|nr:glycine--tRNA ligase subunit beta [bacterium]
DSLTIDNVVYSFEYPTAFLCKIDEKYLELHDYICSTVIKNEKFLPVFRNNRLHGFIAFREGSMKNSIYVTKCFEKVINSRLEDVNFYYEQDMQKKPEEVYEKMKDVYYIGNITLYEKKERVKKHIIFLSKIMGLSESISIKISDYYLIDLVLSTVREYPLLERAFAAIYLEKHGFEEECVKAIFESIKPLPDFEELPRSSYGIVLSIAHRLDDIVINFDLTKDVSQEDPFGIRRNANALVKIFKSIDFDLVQYLNFVAKEFNIEFNELIEFFAKRIRAYFESLGYKPNYIAVFDGEVLNVKKFYEKIESLSNIRMDVLEKLVVCYKRVKNILRKLGRHNFVDEDKFVYDEEKILYDMIKKFNPFSLDAINQILNFYNPLEEFFNKVLVDDPVEDLKRNRLGLLTMIETKFEKFGDLSKL